MPKLSGKKLFIFTKVLIILILPLVVFLLHQRPIRQTKAAGNTYYVAKTGCSDSYPGTESQPWCTIQKAADTAQAGDTVYIKAGTYHERVIPQNSGSPGNYITYTPSPGDEGQVIIAGVGVDVSGGGLFFINNKDYIRVSGLQVINSRNAAIYAANADHVIIENCYTKDSVSSGIGVWDSSNLVVDGNEVVDARNVPMDQGGHEECITISNTDSFEVKNNEVYFKDLEGYLGALGIDVKESSSNGKIHGNYVHDIVNDACIYIDAWDGYNHDHEIYQNLVHNCRDGIAIGGEQGGTVENLKLYNNLIYEVEYGGILIHDMGNAMKKNINIFNNTIAKNYGEWGAGIFIKTDNIENIVLKNNLVNFGWGEVGQIRTFVSTPLNKIISENNLVYGPREQDINYQEIAFGTRETNPLFTDRENNDFYLQPLSPAIDSGSAISFLIQDFDGNPRPQGTGYDIGAYEYTGGVQPTPTPTLTPSNPYDLDGDEQVNAADILILLQNWKNGSQGDFNSDGKVNSLDFGLLAAHWTETHY